MVTRSDVDRLARATGQVSAEAERVLAEFFRSLDLSKPELVRDALLEVVPAITDQFGDLSATVAAEWFEQQRAKEIGGSFSATLGADDSLARVEGSVRWASGEMFRDNPQGTLDLLTGAVQRHVTYAGRDTIARNVMLDPRRPRWAHVPSGNNPCAFCVVMASRGWVYKSAKKANLHSQFHDHCHCQVVASWDHINAHIEGYDPDRFYDMYAMSREDTLGQTVNAMKKNYPDIFGVK